MHSRRTVHKVGLKREVGVVISPWQRAGVYRAGIQFNPARLGRDLAICKREGFRPDGDDSNRARARPGRMIFIPPLGMMLPGGGDAFNPQQAISCSTSARDDGNGIIQGDGKSRRHEARRTRLIGWQQAFINRVLQRRMCILRLSIRRQQRR